MMWLRNAMRAVAVIGAAAALRTLCVAPYRANLVLETVDRRTTYAETLDQASAAPLARRNLDDLTLIETPERLDPDWYLLYGANCEALGRKEDAAEIYSRALRIDQRPEIYVNRGMVMLQLGRMDAAVSDLAVAARFKPDVLYDLNGDLRARVAAAAAHR